MVIDMELQEYKNIFKRELLHFLECESEYKQITLNYWDKEDDVLNDFDDIIKCYISNLDKTEKVMRIFYTPF